jgi:hypothetical protein
MRRAGVWIVRLSLLLFGGLLGLELALQVASLFSTGRGAALPEGARVRVLCVGDSHTYGAGVPADQSYPAQLQQILDARSPGVWGVVNLGVPGMNTTQVRKRLPHWIDEYDADYVIFWAGVNNAWNAAEMTFDREDPAERLDRFLLWSRVYRLVRTRLHDASLEQAGREKVRLLGGGLGERKHADPLQRGVLPEDGKSLAERLGERGTTDRLELDWQRGMDRELGRVEASGAEPRFRGAWQRAEEDVEAMAATVASMGARLLVVTYPVDVGRFAAANRAIRSASDRAALGVIDGPALLAAVPPDELDWHWALHPGARLYREYAGEIADRLANRE